MRRVWGGLALFLVSFLANQIAAVLELSYGIAAGTLAAIIGFGLVVTAAPIRARLWSVRGKGRITLVILATGVVTGLLGAATAAFFIWQQDVAARRAAERQIATLPPSPSVPAPVLPRDVPAAPRGPASTVPSTPPVTHTGPIISWELQKLAGRPKFLRTTSTADEVRVTGFYINGRTDARSVTQRRNSTNRPVLQSAIRRWPIPLMLDGHPFAGVTLKANQAFTLTAVFPSSDNREGMEFGRFVTIFAGMNLYDIEGGPERTAFTLEDVVAHLPPGVTYIGQDHKDRMDYFHSLLKTLDELSLLYDGLDKTVRGWDQTLSERGKAAYLGDVEKLVARLRAPEGPIARLVSFLERVKMRYPDFRFMLTGAKHPPLFEKLDEFRTQVARIAAERPTQEQVQILQPHWVTLDPVLRNFGEWKLERLALVRAKRDQERLDSAAAGN